jgi:Rho GDP-dissociation inhibitor
MSPYLTGMLSRGKYKVRSLISDDDKNRWLEWAWTIEIGKDW